MLLEEKEDLERTPTISDKQSLIEKLSKQFQVSSFINMYQKENYVAYSGT